MGREGFLVFTLLAIIIALSMEMGRVQAASRLPPEDGPLIRHFYKKHNTCANVEPFVRHEVGLFWKKDKSLTAKLLKLLYSDCMTNGCDASILLNGLDTEKTSPKNSGLGAKLPNSGLTVFGVIDKIKTVLEVRCPRAVSCTDILNLATRDAVHFAGAPSYPVFLGRRDGMESKAEWVDYPSPSISWQSALAYFQSKGLDVIDFGTLMGAHTMGKTNCSYILDRLYNFNDTRKPDPSMEKGLLRDLRKQCPFRLKQGQSQPLVFLNPDNGTSYKFTNTYYSRVHSHKSVLGVDQQLLYGKDTNQLVNEYRKSFENLRQEFAFSISRMGGLKVLTGKSGEIRLKCSSTNK